MLKIPPKPHREVLTSRDPNFGGPGVYWSERLNVLAWRHVQDKTGGWDSLEGGPSPEQCALFDKVYASLVGEVNRQYGNKTSSYDGPVADMWHPPAKFEWGASTFQAAGKAPSGERAPRGALKLPAVPHQDVMTSADPNYGGPTVYWSERASKLAWSYVQDKTGGWDSGEGPTREQCALFDKVYVGLIGEMNRQYGMKTASYDQPAYADHWYPRSGFEWEGPKFEQPAKTKSLASFSDPPRRRQGA